MISCIYILKIKPALNMILIKCLVKIDKSLEKQSEKKETKCKKQTKKTNKELTTTNEKLPENCKIVRKKDGTID